MPTVTLDYTTGINDSYIYKTNPNTGYPNNDEMKTITTNQDFQQSGDWAHGLIRFVLSSIPAGATIDSATLYLYNYSNTNGGVSSATAARILQAVNNDYSFCTWNNYASGLAWAVEGCSSDGTDYTSTGSVSVGGITGAAHWVSWNVTTIMKAWVETGLANRGILVYNKNNNWENIKTSLFYQQTIADTALRPYMTVTYTVPTTGTTHRMQQTKNKGWW